MPGAAPGSYSALLGGAVKSAKRGEPETATGSLNSIRIATASPAAYTALPPGEDTETTDGRSASTVMSESDSEPGSPGSGSIRFASLPSPSRIVPLPASRAFLPS